MDHQHMNHMPELEYRFPMPDGPEFSEFNHHLAGIVVILVGLSAILLYYRPRTFSFLRYVWPLSLLVLGIYLVIYSDPGGWPLAYRSLSASLSEPNTRQHKIYAVLLLVMGGIETLRVGGLLKGDRWRYAFPVLAGLGALYLIVHEQGHGGAGGAEQHGGSAAVHVSVSYQHLIYIILGVQAAIALLMYQWRKITGPWAPYIWPSLIVFLGIALLLYNE